MSREKIKEFADDIDEAIDNNMTWHDIDGITDIDAEGMAKELTAKGYRKQSEVIEEYRKKVYGKMEKYTVFGREYIQRIMRETEKEMKGGAE